MKKFRCHFFTIGEIEFAILILLAEPFERRPKEMKIDNEVNRYARSTLFSMQHEFNLLQGFLTSNDMRRWLKFQPQQSPKAGDLKETRKAKATQERFNEHRQQTRECSRTLFAYFNRHRGSSCSLLLKIVEKVLKEFLIVEESEKKSFLFILRVAADTNFTSLCFNSTSVLFLLLFVLNEKVFLSFLCFSEVAFESETGKVAKFNLKSFEFVFGNVKSEAEIKIGSREGEVSLSLEVLLKLFVSQPQRLCLHRQIFL